MKKVLSVLFVALLFALGLPASFAQINGRILASNYAGWTAHLVNGVSSGAATLTLDNCFFQVPGGSRIFPLAINAPFTITDANGETAVASAVTTPVASSGSPNGYTCTATVSLSNAHSAGATVSFGDGGVCSAIASATSAGGGVVTLDPSYSGATAVSALACGSSKVAIEDVSGRSPRYFTMQPSTLTALATPATRSAVVDATNVISGTATGTWTAAATYVCVTYVDQLGGESPCSASYNFTATASVALNFAAPAASTGAVGWRAYAGLTGTSTQYQLPITSANCTLSTQTPYPACAIGSAGVFTTPVTTTALAPGYVVNTYRPNPQGHTTFAYQAAKDFGLSCGGLPVQTDFGPFIASAGGTTGQIEVLGTARLPDSCLNSIGKTIRVSGRITMTAGTSETPVLKVMLGPSFTTGTPTAICSMADTTALSAAVYNAKFSCDITTNAIGASGTVVPSGFLFTQLGAGTTTGAVAVDTATAAITNKLDTANSIYVVYVPTSGTNTAAQLLDLHLEEL